MNFFILKPVPAVFVVASSVLTMLTSCSSLERSSGSGYAVASQNGKVTLSAPQELGTPDFEEKQKIKALESQLMTRPEKEQYSEVIPWLSQEERIEFLLLPDVAARQKWIRKNEIDVRRNVPENSLKDAIAQNDIAMGMPQDFVRKSWGEPSGIEVSGNPVYKNEKWTYLRSISNNEGFRREKRTVYFEAGRVVGWDTKSTAQ